VEIVQDAPLAPIYVKSLAGDGGQSAVDTLTSEFDQDTEQDTGATIATASDDPLAADPRSH
jgi:hypothetical protein